MRAKGRRRTVAVAALAAASLMGAGGYYRTELWGAIRDWRLGRRVDAFLAKAAACGQRDVKAIQEALMPEAASLARAGLPLIPILSGMLARQDPPDAWRRKWILHLLLQAVPEHLRDIELTRAPLGLTFGDGVECTDGFSGYYGRILDAPYRIAPGLAVHPPEEIDSPGGTWRLRFQTTDAAKVPYSDAIGTLDFLRRDDGARRHIVFERFRILHACWLTDRLMFLSTDLGHAAGADHLFDVEEGRWLYQMGDQYYQ
jgi:hypothetical protein